MSEWISVKDKKPDTLSTVLIYCDNLAHQFGTGYFAGSDFYLNKSSGLKITNVVTHWMPFPDAPEKKDENCN